MFEIYEVIFKVSFVLMVLNVLISSVMDIFNLDLNIDSPPEIPMMDFIPLRSILLLLWAVITSGLGMMCLKIYNLSNLLSFIIPFIIGYIVCVAINKFIINSLKRVEKQCLAVESNQLIGMEATVLSAILENSMGSINYSVKGSIYTSSAKDINNQYVKQDTLVKIIKIENGIFYIEKQ